MRASFPSRRQFVRTSISSVTSAWLSLRWPAILAAREHAQQQAKSHSATKFEFFSPEQAAEVDAMCAQIIPSDNSAGARDAHVIYFIDRVLVTLDRDSQPKYIQGLKVLQEKAGSLVPGSAQFSSLSSEQQIQVLTSIEKIDFFELVRFHTILGFLARPEYGGNYNKVGWKLIGLEDQMIFQPPFGYYDEEEDKRNHP
jgi:gluconate 2-dehydrogenase gamma chain